LIFIFPNCEDVGHLIRVSDALGLVEILEVVRKFAPVVIHMQPVLVVVDPYCRNPYPAVREIESLESY